MKLAGSDTFENKAQLIKALENLNYRVEQDVKVKGKSGTEYTFDIVAYEDDAVTGHKLVIDFINAEGEIPLERISLFEVKSYDVGFSDKAIVVSAPLSQEAKQFAQKYAIQIIQIEQKLPVQPQENPGNRRVNPPKSILKNCPFPPANPAKLVPEV